jgi:hypothetical protein
METEEERRAAREREERAQWNDENRTDSRARYQRVLDQWVRSQRELEEEERGVRRALDPFGWGHWK